MPTGRGPGLRVGETPEIGPAQTGRTLEQELRDKGLAEQTGDTEGGAEGEGGGDA